jgi:hypothetical protein
LLNVLSVSGKPKIFANNLGEGGGGASASGIGGTTDDGGGLGGGAVAFGMGGFDIGAVDDIGDDMSFPSESRLIS